MMKKVISVLLTAVLASAMMTSVVSAVEVPTDGDVAEIVANGELIVGITDFEPMDYKDENGEWIGFDADLAAAVAEMLGVDVVYTEIDWDNKILELKNKSIDCVWNGMTITPEVQNSMAVTNAYCNNAQVVVLSAEAAEGVESIEDLKELAFAVESGSAGEAAAEENELDYTSVLSQADALLEVSSGNSDAAIIDLLMASAMTGEGTSYPELTHVLELTTEEYGIGCRQESNLCDFINAAMVELYADGTMTEIAEEYGLADAVIEQK